MCKYFHRHRNLIEIPLAWPGHPSLRWQFKHGRCHRIMTLIVWHRLGLSFVSFSIFFCLQPSINRRLLRAFWLAWVSWVSWVSSVSWVYSVSLVRVAKATKAHHVEMLPLLFSSLVLHRTPPASLFSCSSFDALAALCSDILSLWHICIITLPPGSPEVLFRRIPFSGTCVRLCVLYMGALEQWRWLCRWGCHECMGSPPALPQESCWRSC